MKLLWLKSLQPLSLLIRLVTGEDCSHFTFVFESQASGLLFESDLLGTHPAFLTTVMKSHTLVHSMPLDIPIEIEDKIWDTVVEKYDGLQYDYFGAIYLGLRILLKRLFKIPLPQKNVLREHNTYFCEEIYKILSDNISTLPKVDTPMTTPHMLWEKLNALRDSK